MNNLYICRTPFQIITALVLHYNDFKQEKADIVIFDTMNDYFKIAERIRKEEIFENVYCVCSGNLNNAFLMSYGVLNPKYFLKKVGFEKREFRRIFTNSLYGDFENALYYYSKNSEIILYDEGYSTYTSDFLYAIRKFSKSHSLIRYLSKLLFRRNYIDEIAEKIYLYDPELCVCDMPFITNKIQIDFSAVDNIIEKTNRVFEVSQAINEYKVDNIFFEESFANDFKENNDLEIINTISKVVGKDNMMIKLHPRDKTNRFNDLGYKTNSSLYVPWEAVVLNIGNTEKTFMTFSSGAVLNYKFLCKNSAKTILLYKVFSNCFVNMSEEKLEWFRKFEDKYGEEFIVPETIQELEDALKQRK